MKIPYTEEEINEACMDAANAQGFEDGYVRPVVFRGSEMMAVSAQTTKIHVAIAAWPWPSYFDPAAKLKGIRLDISEWKRPAPDTAPSKAKAAGLYMICTMSKHAAEAKGYADALMLDYRGYVAEGDRRQYFLRQGRHAAHADPRLLPRRHHAPLGDRPRARTRQIPVVERHIEPEEIGGLHRMLSSPARPPK